MKNNDIYKNAMDNIHASEELKNETLKKALENAKVADNKVDDSFKKVETKKKNNMIFLKLLSACAVFAIVFGIGAVYHNNPNIIELALPGIKNEKKNEDLDLPKFENIEELRKVLAKSSSGRYNYYYDDDVVFETMDASGASESSSLFKSDTNSARTTTINDDYSKTNVQVEDVDEADIVKTDGKYIYLVKGNLVFIVEADSLKIVKKLDFDENDDDFMPREIFIKDNKMIVVGTSYIFEDDEAEEIDDEEDDEWKYDRYYSYYNYQRTVTQAVVIDISNKNKPNEERRVTLDGYYANSRMVDNNVYLISNKSVYYYDKMKDREILPFYIDTADGTDQIMIPAEDIAYFGGTRNYSYMLVAGFDITNDEKASVETIFGASDTVYASSDNLYIVQEKYSSYSSIRSVIYKFELKGSQIELKAKGSVKGYLNNQFSMDEYDGNLRVATTSNIEGLTKNQLYVLDENLEKIGSIKNMALDEKIYSVRFIGKVGYIVTFKQIDPLFVIDLSDPTNPEIKGKLKIPGYSSYLDPYDENHIIGIGYNTKTNEWGGTTNQNMKMSMFDVSDLENPKEMFSVDIGDGYAYSEITSNHKALFYNKAKNLIGFPIRYNSTNYKNSNSGFVIYKIDLNKGFEKYGELTEKTDYSNSPKRVIYIGDLLYTIFDDDIESYDLNTLKIKDTLEIK